MTKIKEMVDLMCEEIEGAKMYAEKYIEYKAKGDTTWANKFKEMASQEIVHSQNIHDLTMREIEELSKVFTPPTHMQEAWDKSHKEYVEKVAWIKQMLAM